MTTTPTAPPIAVLGSPSLSSALGDVGFRPVSGPTFKDAATEINKLLSQAPAAPIVADLSYADETGFEWLVGDLAERAADAGARFVLVASRPSHEFAQAGKIAHVTVVPLPSSVSDVVRAAGFQLPSIPAAEVVIEPDEPPASPIPVPIPMPTPITAPIPESPSASITATPPTPETVSRTVASSWDDEPSAGVSEQSEMDAARRAREALLDEQMRAITERVEKDAAAPETTQAPELVREQAAESDALTKARVSFPNFDQMPLFMRDRILADLSMGTNVPAPTPTTVVEQPAFAGPITPPTDLFPAAEQTRPPAAPVPTGGWNIPAAVAPAPAEAQTPPVDTEPRFDVPPAYTKAPQQTASAPAPAPAPHLFGGEDSILPAGPKRGVLVVVIAGSGGVGKTSTAVDLVKTASETVNPLTGTTLKAVIIDANRGQPDVGKRMRLPEGVLPTIYDTVTSGQPSASFVKPDSYNPYRAQAIDEPLRFGAVFGPPAMYADSTPAFAYGQAIDYARANADIVVVDTQIIEATQSDLFREVLIPRLRSDGWLVAAYDHKGTSKDNIFERLSELIHQGISRARVLIVARNVYAFPPEAAEQVERMIGGNGTFVGAMLHDDTYERDTDIGRFRTDLPAIAPVIGKILYTVTGLQGFAQVPVAQTRNRRGVLGWIRR
ncbi:hypothetical protein [Microbacterium enclense]|uniref:hypothetical protein n=1 Tax=Microbacterium enclense TaxID=993073 RepID=UPI003F800E22